MSLLRKEVFIGLVVGFLFLGWSAGGFGQEVQTITVKGEGWFEGSDGLIGKDRAINDALRKAVEQAVGTLVSSETMVQNFQTLNDQIYLQSQGYVQSYKILSESQRPNVYEVTIQASVATGPIKEKLEAAGATAEIK